MNSAFGPPSCHETASLPMSVSAQPPLGKSNLFLHLDACLSQRFVIEKLKDSDPPGDPADIERAIKSLKQVYGLFDDDLDLNDPDNDELFRLAALVDPSGPSSIAQELDSGSEEEDEIFQLAALNDPHRPAANGQPTDSTSMESTSSRTTTTPLPNVGPSTTTNASTSASATTSAHSSTETGLATSGTNKRPSPSTTP